ncbi:MAG: hypothetical protein M1827_000985 [Pycnora praestabilis]|nr:MAG: hypothetical protein M1827_000985 [Pycnora praestabilis]
MIPPHLSRPNKRLLQLLTKDHLRAISTSPLYATPVSTQSLPRVAQPSIWQSLIPTSLRRSSQPSVSPKRQKTKEWNPATFFIVIFMLIGSQAIQMIALRYESLNFSRKADAKIGLLKDVIERVQRGEEVDVEGLLGTGDKAKEKEWEDVLREIELEDALWQSRSGKRKLERSTDDAIESSSTAEATNFSREDTIRTGKSDEPETSAKRVPREYY